MGNKFSVQGVLALGIAIAFVGLVALWMLHPPSGDKDVLALLNALIMVVGSAFLSIVNFFFGSSTGSKEKDDNQRDLLDRMANHITQEQNNGSGRAGKAIE